MKLFKSHMVDQFSAAFNDYISQKPEFKSLKALAPYYHQYDGHPDDEEAVEFWR